MPRPPLVTSRIVFTSISLSNNASVISPRNPQSLDILFSIPILALNIQPWWSPRVPDSMTASPGFALAALISLPSGITPIPDVLI